MREYKTAKGWAIFIYVTAPFLVGLFTWLLVDSIRKADSNVSSTGIHWFLALLAIGLIAFIGYALIEIIKWKFVINSNKVYAAGAFSFRQLKFDEIRGYRINENYISIEPNVAGKKAIKISSYTGNTHEIVAWLNSKYPDLDLLNAEKEEEEILSNEALGFSLEQREEKLKNARKTAKILNWTGTLVAIWTFVWANPYEYAIIASILVPIIAIIAFKLSSGLIRVDERKDSAYPSILLAFLAPGMVICVRALVDFNILNHFNVWLPTAIITLTATALLFVGNSEFRFKKAIDFFSLLVVASIFFAYSYGSVIIINCLYDNSEPVSYKATVLSKRVSSGKSTTYYLELTSWGAQKETEEVSVSQGLYERLDQKDRVNIYLMKGSLNIPWFEVTD